MKIEFEGKTWQLEPDDIRNRQAEAIFDYTGLTVSKWLQSLAKDVEEPKWIRSWDAMYWLMLVQNEPPHPASPAEVDYPLYRFAQVYLQAVEAAAATVPEAEPDPTLPPVVSALSPESSTPEKLSSSDPGGGVTTDG
jgi:ABC-type Zn uptake system ZnuABC Zn-binding protein ZnuA